MARNEVSLLIRIRQTGESVFSKVSAGLSGIAAAGKAVLYGAAAVGGFIYAVQRLAEAGEKNLAVMARFRGSMQGLGFDADGVVKKLTQVTRGLLDDSDLMKLANKGIVDGGLSVEQLAKALEFATFKAQELEVPVTEFASQMTQALASGNLRGLVEAFPAIRLQLEQLDANGALDNQRKRAEGVRLVFQAIAHDLPGLREDLGKLPVGAQRFGVALHDALEKAQNAIASSPAVEQFFKDTQAAITKLIEKLPELLPKIEAVVGGIAKISEAALKLFGNLAENLSGEGPTGRASILGAALENSMNLLARQADPDGPAARRIKDNIKTLLHDIGREVRDGGSLTGLTQGQRSAVARALDQIAEGTIRYSGIVKDRLLIARDIGNDVRAALIAASNAVAGAKPGDTNEPATGAPRTRLNLGGIGEGIDEKAKKFTDALNYQRQLYEGGVTSLDKYKEAIASFVDSLHSLAEEASGTTVATGDASAALSVLDRSGKASRETVVGLTGSVKNFREDLFSLVDFEPPLAPWNALDEQLKQMEATAAQVGATLAESFSPDMLNQFMQGIEDSLDRFIAMGEKFASTLQDAFSHVLTSIANTFAELVGGGTAEYKQQTNELKAKEREVRLEFEQGKLSAEQYQEQLSRIAQERAALKEANNPFKKFAASVLGTLGDLAISLGVFALAYGKFRTGLLANPFGVAAAAFAAGIILKVAAAKVGGSIGGMRGDIGSVSGGGVAGFNSSSDSSEQRPIVFVNIVGQTTGEVVKSLVYDVARFGNTGGRIPGQAKQSAVTVPGLVVQEA